MPSLSYSRTIRDDQNQLWAVGVCRKRDRKIIHSLCLIFTTFVLISLSVHRPCAGGAYPWVNEGISWLTHRRGAPFLHTPSISAPRNVRQLIPMAQPDLDTSPMRDCPPDGRIHHLRRLGRAVSWNTDDPPFSERKPKLQSDAALRLLLGSRLRVRGIFPFGRGSSS